MCGDLSFGDYCWSFNQLVRLKMSQQLLVQIVEQKYQPHVHQQLHNWLLIRQHEGVCGGLPFWVFLPGGKYP